MNFVVFRISLVNLFLFETHPHGQMENIHSFQQLVPVVDLPLPSLSPPPDVNTFFSNFTKSDPFFFNSLFNIDLTFFYLEKYIWHITLFQKGLANSWILWIASKWFESYSTGRKEVVFINDSDPEISDIMWCTTWMSFLLVFVHITISIMS